MKGMFFKGSQEYRIEVEGEQWKQSAWVKGTLSVRAHAGAATTPFFVALARASEKKVKAKAEGAFEVLERRESDPAGGPLSWSFELSEKSPVSDANKSLYVLYGPSEPTKDLVPGTIGALQLKILPHQHIEDLISVISTTFRFPLKKVTAVGSAGASGAVEIRFDPPEGKSFSSTDALTVTAALDFTSKEGLDGEVKLGFYFQVRDMDTHHGMTQVKKTEREANRVILLSDLLHRFNGRVNRDFFEKTFQEVLSEVYQGRLF